MPRTALTPEQEEQVRIWIRSGATIPSAHLRCCEQGWNVGLARVGQLAQEARRAAGAITLPAAPTDLTALEARLAVLERRLEAIQQLPTETLSEATIAAVTQCRRLTQDPGVEPRVQVQALGQLPELIRLAKEIRDAEKDASDALWTPEPESTEEKT